MYVGLVSFSAVFGSLVGKTKCRMRMTLRFLHISSFLMLDCFPVVLGCLVVMFSRVLMVLLGGETPVFDVSLRHLILHVLIR